MEEVVLLQVAEHPNGFSAEAGGEPREDKRSCSRWMRLALLFITIFTVEGLLIVWATLLLKGSLFDQHSRGEDGAENEILQLRGDLKRITALLHNVTMDSRCLLCPERWLWFWGHCYFLSVGLRQRQWAQSLEYCAKHNSSLAVIQHQAEMEFILGQVSGFSDTPFLWLGLSDLQEEGLWVWQDGTPLQKHGFMTVEWDSEDRDCADLRGDGSVFASDCMAYGPWLCEKVMEPPEFVPTQP